MLVEDANNSLAFGTGINDTTEGMLIQHDPIVGMMAPKINDDNQDVEEDGLRSQRLSIRSS